MRSYYRVYNSEDPESLRAFYHPDVELTTGDSTMQGVDVLLDAYRDIIARFYDKMTPSHIAIDDGVATVHILDRFTAKCDVDDFMGQAFTAGDSLTLHLRATYEFLDGKFRRIEISFDH